MDKIQVFSHELFGDIRTMTNEKGETFFVGKDMAEALGYKNAPDAISKHVDDEDKLESRIAISGQRRNVIFINESGLYSLVLSSKLPQAKAFKRWVTSEVLPQIRKTGGYIPTKDAEGRKLTDLEIVCLAVKIQQRTIEEQYKLIGELAPNFDVRKWVKEELEPYIEREAERTGSKRLRAALPRKITT